MYNTKLIMQAYKEARTKAKAKANNKGWDCPACGLPVVMVDNGAYCPAYCDEWDFDTNTQKGDK